VILAAALGAFAGDQTSYGAGRLAGPRLYERAERRSRRRAALDRARRALATRGGTIIVVSRYVPGARTAVTLSAGAVGYRWRRFAAFGAVAAALWGTYSALVGYIGGATFEDDPLKGLLLGFGVAVAVSAAVELTRLVVRRRRAGSIPTTTYGGLPCGSPGPLR
jgi:membrane protein DedA with SNARE-associated domain